MNGNYPNYQKVGKIMRMCVQFVPGSSFLCTAHTKSLGTRLLSDSDINKQVDDIHKETIVQAS